MKIKVVILNPGQEPFAQEIEDTLESKQKLVGGYIEYVPLLGDRGKGGLELVCNEEGKIHGLEPNRTLVDEIGRVYDVTCGTCFVTKTNEETGEAVSLSDDDVYHAKRVWTLAKSDGRAIVAARQAQLRRRGEQHE